MSDDKTWSMNDMEMVWADGDGKSTEASKPEAPTIELAKAVKKPIYHNSKVKAALLLLGGTCFAALGTLLFNLTSSKTPEKVTAETPQTTTQTATATNDGWKTAAEQSASDAGAGIDIAKKSGTEETPPSTTQQTTKPIVTSSTTQPPTPATNNLPTKPSAPTTAPTVAPAVVKASPAVKTPAQPVAVTPPVVAKPIVTQPVAPKAIALIAPKTIPFAPGNPPVKPLPIVTQPPVAKPQVPKAITIPLVAQAPKPQIQVPIVPPSAPKPEAKPVAIVKPEPKPVASAPIIKPEAKPVIPPVAVATKSPSAPTPISWEQASAAGVYGGDSASVMPPVVGGLGVNPGVKDSGKQQLSNNYDGAMSPSLLLAAGTNVKGHTLAPFIASAASASNKQNNPAALSIGLDESIELGQGFHLPVGTTINFIASVNDNGSINAVSRNANINGVEVPIPEGAITLSSDKNDLLMTKEITPGSGDLARADLNSSIWGGVAGAGEAILQSGGTTTTNVGLLGTSTTQTNNGSPNIIGGVLKGAFTPLAANGQRRAQQTADRIEQRSRVNTIDVGTKVKIFVNIPIKIQIPVSGQVTGQTNTDDDESQTPSRLITSNSVPSPANEEELPPPPLKPIAVQPPTVVAPLPPVQSSVVAAPSTLEVKQTPTVTPLPANPPKTRISIP
jgi:hypothetical protein